jgi:hypothetical protein
MTVVLIIILIFGGGTSLAAEKALPGDFLYPVKVNINEEARGLVSFSTKDQAAWKIRQVERRLLDGEKLIIQQRFTDEVRRDLEIRFDEQAAEFFNQTARLATQNNLGDVIELQSNFEATLRAHDDVLRQLGSSEEGLKIILQSWLDKVGLAADQATKFRQQAEAQVAGPDQGQFITAAEAKRNSVEQQLTEVRELLIKLKLSTEVQTAAEANLKQASLKILQGANATDAQNYGQAFANFQEAERLVNTTRLVILAEQQLGLEIKVPLILPTVSGN